eukprot:7298620-Prymnesium_polylepis.1
MCNGPGGGRGLSGSARAGAGSLLRAGAMGWSRWAQTSLTSVPSWRRTLASGTLAAVRSRLEFWLAAH